MGEIKDLDRKLRGCFLYGLFEDDEGGFYS